MTSGGVVVESADSLIGKIVQGRFEVLERLAAGGMGVVYKAIQQPLGRPVAFKVLEIAMGTVDDSFQQRFFLEASAAAKLAHPNTIVVHDYGKSDQGHYFIAMEYLDGGSLGNRLESMGPLAPAEAIHVGMQIASSLHDAHQQGLVHRDMKPGNVMFAPRGGDPLFVKVLDFGLVKMVGEGQGNLGLTQSGVMMGSPRYMAPEQVRAQSVDARTDIYSFGAVLYHMVAGAPPFSAGSAFEAMQHHVYTEAPPLRAVWPGCPASAALEQVIHRCLAKDPAHRFQRMDEVFDALRAAMAHEVGGSMSSSYLVGPSAASELSAAIQLSESGEQSRPPGWSQAPESTREPSSRQQTLRYDGPPLEAGISSSGMRAQRGPASSFSHPPPASAPAAAAPPRKKPGLLRPLLLGFTAVFVLGSVGIAMLLLPWERMLNPETEVATQPADPTPPEAPPEPDVPEPPATPAAETPTTPTDVAPAQEASTLQLRTDPSGATVRRDGADLGDTPLTLRIPAGERCPLAVGLRGYETRTVMVAGGQPELLLHLTPAPTRGAPTPPRPRLTPQVRPLAPARPRGGRDVYAPDLNNPWAE
ncbi:MAG: serine/threonine-protein kinase [Sandaracinaceae bacterium]